MKTVIVSRKLIWLLVLCVLCFSLLFLIKQVRQREQTMIPGTQVSTPAAGEVIFHQPGETTGPAGGSASSEDANFYVEYRLERERARGQRVEWLREVINNAHSNDETRQKAQEDLMSISNCMAKEVELENLIKAKGYRDAAVLIDTSSVTAVVAAGSLAAAEAGGLADLLARGTGVDPGSIIVIAKE